MNFSDIAAAITEAYELLQEMEKDGSAQKFREAEELAKQAQASECFQKLITGFQVARLQPQQNLALMQELAAARQQQELQQVQN